MKFKLKGETLTRKLYVTNIIHSHDFRPKIIAIGEIYLLVLQQNSEQNKLKSLDSALSDLRILICFILV